MWNTFERHSSWRRASSLDTDVDDHRVLGLGEIGDGEEIGGLEIGDDEGVAAFEDLLGLGDDVAILRHDGLVHLEFVADESAGLVRLFQHQPRALNAFVGDRLLGIGQGQRLLVLLAEIDDAHRLGRLGGAGHRRSCGVGRLRRRGRGRRCRGRGCRRLGRGRGCRLFRAGGAGHDRNGQHGEGQEGCRGEAEGLSGAMMQTCNRQTQHRSSFAPICSCSASWVAGCRRSPAALWRGESGRRFGSTMFQRYGVLAMHRQSFCQIKQWQG